MFQQLSRGDNAILTIQAADSDPVSMLVVMMMMIMIMMMIMVIMMVIMMIMVMKTLILMVCDQEC